jgi:hypothetical protein
LSKEAVPTIGKDKEWSPLLTSAERAAIEAYK